MTLPPQFRSGDIIRMETSSGPLVARLLDLKDPDWFEFRWDWPHDPEVQHEIERAEER